MIIQGIEVGDQFLIIFKFLINLVDLLNLLEIFLIALYLLFHFVIDSLQDFDVLGFILDRLSEFESLNFSR